MQEAGGNYFGVEKFKRKGQRESFDLCPARSFKDNWEGLKKFNNNPLSTSLIPVLYPCLAQNVGKVSCLERTTTNDSRGKRQP
jgi:hypothetical protein